MLAHPQMLASRRSIVEHPFSNLKQWLFGDRHFLLRQLVGAKAEMALGVNAYNLKRAISVLGARQLMALMCWKVFFRLLPAQKQTPRAAGDK
jgi:transposase